MNFLFKTFFICLCSISTVVAGQPDYVDNCQSCHGAINDLLEYQAPQLKGLKKQAILEQLKNYQQGLRGKGSRAAEAMAAAVQQYDEQQLKEIASWVAGLDGQPYLSYAEDSADPGTTLFVEQCHGCHQSFIGRLMTGSPRLDYLSGEYVVAQLNFFRTDERAIKAPNKHQQKMLLVTKALSEQELELLNSFFLKNAADKAEGAKK